MIQETILKYGKIFIGIVIFIFVTIVLNGIIVSMENKMIEDQNNINISKFINLVWVQYLSPTPLIIIGYFAAFVFILFILDFYIFFLLDLGPTTCNANDNISKELQGMINISNADDNISQDHSLTSYLKNNGPLMIKVFATLSLLNIFLLVFVTIFLILPKYFDDKNILKRRNIGALNSDSITSGSGEINEIFIRRFFKFYRYSFLIGFFFILIYFIRDGEYVN